MEKAKLEEFYNKVIAKFGIDKQTWQAIEEMGELMTAINQLKRGRISYTDVCTEIADVQIMMEQLSIIYGKKIVESEKIKKIERLKNRLNGKEY
jgi:NTP pyrophosphatase (non-canonical NTP hydrolase)